MSTIVDRRSDKNLSAGNRKKFKDHYKDQIKRAIQDKVKGKSITDKTTGEDIIFDMEDDITPPISKDFSTGKPRRVAPGNKTYGKGDSFPMDPNGGGGGGRGQSSEDIDTEMIFTLTEQEFLELYFSDLELPNFVKKAIFADSKPVLQRAGYKADGVSSQLDLKKSMKHSIARRLSAKSARKTKIDELECECYAEPSLEKRTIIRDEINKLKDKHDIYLDDFDLKYRRYEPVPKPDCKALVFFLLDMSGSMTERMVSVARRFFYLMMLFLGKEYEHVEPVFIQYTMEAKIVDEQTFFNTYYSGGTDIKKPLDLMLETIKTKYNSDEWNIYVTHACDSESIHDDSGVFIDEIHNIIVKGLQQYIQYYAYLHIMGESWGSYQPDPNDRKIYKLFRRLSQNDWLGCAVASNVDESYQAMRKLFEKDRDG